MSQTVELTEKEKVELVDVEDDEEVQTKREVEKDARTIFERMIAIIDELPAIGKTQENVQQHFMFRGHDDVLNALNPLLSKHGVFVTPNVVERVTDQRTTSRGSMMYEVNLHVQYTFFGAGGDWIVASAWGEGTDMGDKATNKAMTMAMKAVLNQAFAINTEEQSKQDADKSTPDETVRANVRVEPSGPAPPQSWAEALKRFDKLIGIDGEGSPWLEELVESKWGVHSIADLDQTQRREAMVGFSSALMLLEEQQGDLGLQKDPRAIVQAAFAMKNGGIKLEGPPWRMSPDETGLPTRSEYLDTKTRSDDDDASGGGGSGEGGV